MMGPSLRPLYVVAVAAYLVGYPLLIHLAANLRTFDALWPERTSFELADIPIPRGLTVEQAFAYATCVSSAQCELMVAAYAFVPLAIVSSAVRGLVARTGGFGPARPQPAFLFCLLSCLVLVPVSHFLLLGPLVGVDGLFSYAERWAHLPMINLIQHAGFAIAAWFAAHHCVRAYAPAPSAALLDAVCAGDADPLVELLRAGADPNATGDDGGSALHLAAASGDAEVVRTLLAGDADLSMWKSPLGRPSSTRRTGTEGDDEIKRKLPSEAGLHAMAEIFANDPQDAPTRFVSAVWALLMSAPWRISEVLALHVGAEYEETDDKGVVSYGFRYFGAKGFAHDVKWVPKTMEAVAREAFRRLWELTESARAFARHLEASSDTPFLYSDAPDVGFDDPLTLEQKAAYLRKPLPKRVQSSDPEWRFRSIRERWEKARSRVPRGFPAFPSRNGLKWSGALCCLHRNLLHDTRPVDWYGLIAPTANTVNDLLGSGRWKTGVPARLSGAAWRPHPTP